MLCHKLHKRATFPSSDQTLNQNFQDLDHPDFWRDQGRDADVREFGGSLIGYTGSRSDRI